jgi:glycosyltransferase involved in cell wall biosynthesis
LKSFPVKALLHYLRLWDWAASDRVDTYAAIAACVARRIWRAYRRAARVIYPPVEIERFSPLEPGEDYYIVLSRLEGHKRVALVVEAFARLGLPLLVIGEGREHARLARLATPNVRLLGWQPDRVVRQLLGRARALVHGAEEDFGIALVEAQAAGCPVIAYAGGGALETVLPGRTGFLFPEQTVESLAAAIEAFEREKCPFDPADLRANAARFSKARFQRELARLVCDEWQVFNG